MNNGWVGYTELVYTLDKGISCIPDRIEQNSTKFHHGMQKGAQSKTYELFTSGIFHSQLGLWVTETEENKTA
jgi:hypothetical protein